MEPLSDWMIITLNCFLAENIPTPRQGVHLNLTLSKKSIQGILAKLNVMKDIGEINQIVNGLI